jgi:hypothetical protein
MSLSGTSAYGGRPAGKSAALHCTIAGYLGDHHGDLAEAIDRLCLGRFLTPGGPVGGVTFLIPTLAVAKQIQEMSAGEDADEAMSLVEAHIVPACFKSARDWVERAAEAGNRLGQGFGDAAPAGKEGVKFTASGGHSFEIAPTPFKTLRAPTGVTVGPVAVWRVVSGTPPKEGEGVPGYRPPARPPRGGPRGDGPGGPRGGRAGYGGGGVFGGAGPDEDAVVASCHWRRDLGDKVFRAYAEAVRAGTTASDAPILAKVVGLLNHLKQAHSLVYQSVWPLIDPDPIVTFLLLVEPFKVAVGPIDKGQYFLLSPAMLHGSGGTVADAVTESDSSGGPERPVPPIPWGGGDPVGGMSLKDAYLAHLKEAPVFVPPQAGAGAGAGAGGAAPEMAPLVLTDPRAFRRLVDQVRETIASNRDWAAATKTAYANFFKDNRLCGTGPIIPQALFQHLCADRLLWIDQLRVRVRDLHREVVEAPPRARDVALAAVAALRWHAEFQMPGDDYAAEQYLPALNKGLPCGAREALMSWGLLVNSTSLFGFAIPSTMIGEAWDDRIVAGAGEGVFNGAYEALIVGGAEGTAPRRGGISGGALTELAHFVAGGGTLADLGL